MPPSHLPSKANYYLFKVCYLLSPSASSLTDVSGGHHSRLGRRCQQKRREMEHPVAQGQEPRQRGQNVALHGLQLLYPSCQCPLTIAITDVGRDWRNF
jgi:hypothetical protein